MVIEELGLKAKLSATIFEGAQAARASFLY